MALLTSLLSEPTAMVTPWSSVCAMAGETKSHQVVSSQTDSLTTRTYEKKAAIGDTDGDREKIHIVSSEELWCSFEDFHHFFLMVTFQ